MAGANTNTDAPRGLSAAGSASVFRSSLFSQVNVGGAGAPLTDAELSSWDNAELEQMGNDVYTFAQQDSSRLLPHLSDVGEMEGLFLTQDRFNQYEWSIRSDEVGKTPHAKHQNSTRSVTSVRLHAGHIMDMDFSRTTRYSIQPKVQAELGKSLGRVFDTLIQLSCIVPVAEYETPGTNPVTNRVIDHKDFMGVPQAKTSYIPDESLVILGSAASPSTKIMVRWNAEAVDELVHDFENDDWEARDICVVMTPLMRRQLKQDPDFRNAENNQSFVGNENARVVVWKDVTFLSVSKSVALKGDIAEKLLGEAKSALKSRVFSYGSKYTKAGQSGGNTGALSTFVGYFAATQLATVAFVKKAIKFRVPVQGGFYSRIAPRRDLQDATELYMRAAAGALRVDDSGVRVIFFGTAKPA